MDRPCTHSLDRSAEISLVCIFIYIYICTYIYIHIYIKIVQSSEVTMDRPCNHFFLSVKLADLADISPVVMMEGGVGKRWVEVEGYIYVYIHMYIYTRMHIYIYTYLLIHIYTGGFTL